MAAHLGKGAKKVNYQASSATREPLWIKWTLLTLALGFFLLFLVMPLATVFIEAFRKGWDVYIAALVEPDALSAIWLTLIIAAIAVPLNLVFGVASAWSIT